MPRYRVTHVGSKPFKIVEAPYTHDACTLAGWRMRDCHVEMIREGPFTYPQQPEVLMNAQRLHNLQTEHALACQALRNIRLLTQPEPLDLDTARRLLRRIHQLAGGDEKKP